MCLCVFYISFDKYMMEVLLPFWCTWNFECRRQFFINVTGSLITQQGICVVIMFLALPQMRYYFFSGRGCQDAPRPPLQAGSIRSWSVQITFGGTSTVFLFLFLILFSLLFFFLFWIPILQTTYSFLRHPCYQLVSSLVDCKNNYKYYESFTVGNKNL